MQRWVGRIPLAFIVGAAFVAATLPAANAHAGTQEVDLDTFSIDIRPYKSGAVQWTDMGAADKTWTITVGIGLDGSSADTVQHTIAYAVLADGTNLLAAEAMPVENWEAEGVWTVVFSMTAHSNGQPDLYVQIVSQDSVRQSYIAMVDAYYW